MKKLLIVLALVFVLCLAMATPVLAQEPPDNVPPSDAWPGLETAKLAASSHTGAHNIPGPASIPVPHQ